MPQQKLSPVTHAPRGFPAMPPQRPGHIGSLSTKTAAMRKGYAPLRKCALKRRPLSALLRILEPLKPFAQGSTQLCNVQFVDSFPAELFHAQQPCPLENPEMARGGRPRARESLRDLAGRHFASAKPQYQQNLSALGMRQRVEHCFSLFEFPVGSRTHRSRTL